MPKILHFWHLGTVYVGLWCIWRGRLHKILPYFSAFYFKNNNNNGRSSVIVTKNNSRILQMSNDLYSTFFLEIKVYWLDVTFVMIASRICWQFIGTFNQIGQLVSNSFPIGYMLNNHFPQIGYATCELTRIKI